MAMANREDDNGQCYFVLTHFKDGYKLEIVDVCEYPRRALDDGILVTPSLAKVSPAPGANVIGNLSDTGSVLAALGVRLPAGA